MGIFNFISKIFHSSSNDSKQEDKKSVDVNNDQMVDNPLNVIEDNKKEKKDNKNILCLKIYIVGTGEKKNYIINNLFKEEITDPYLKTIADRELKTEQFHWIARIYNEEKLEDNCQKLSDEIMKDKGTIENKDKLLKYQVILCFGNENENVKTLSENFGELCKSRMIFVTDEKCDLDETMDKRYATFIICKDITNNEDLNIKIISSLWEIDCCFNEIGNQICRYTPEKIFNGLEKDNSMFSINILLTGLSRSGKSTFINLLAGKIMALEADNAESVTKNISEYYIYRDDDKDEHGAIKIIDTPGIVANQNANNLEYKEVENKVINMIKEQDKTFENKIHFIFFIFMKGNSLEGENINELFKALNDSKCPVYLIMNKSSRNNRAFSSDIKSTICHLNLLGCKNLAMSENFINANFKTEEDGLKVHGIEKIFNKIKEHINARNYIDINLKKEMVDLLNDFNSKIVVNESFNSYEKDDKIIIKELKSKMKYNERMTKIMDMTNNNYLFSKINVSSLIINGRNLEEKCKKVIISLSNLKGIFPSVSQDIPILSIFQAVMVKEIAEGYGLNIDILSSGTKFLLSNIRKNLKSMNNIQIDNNKSEILDYNEISESLDIIENKVKDKLERGKNRESILTLAKLLKILREKTIKELKNSNQEFSEEKFTNEISAFCVAYFENELIESKGLVFMLNYFNKCESLLKDIEYYCNKNEWDNYDIEIKK